LDSASGVQCLGECLKETYLVWRIVKKNNVGGASKLLNNRLIISQDTGLSNISFPVKPANLHAFPSFSFICVYWGTEMLQKLFEKMKGVCGKFFFQYFDSTLEKHCQCGKYVTRLFT
jgi:hypothetical protein